MEHKRRIQKGDPKWDPKLDPKWDAKWVPKGDPIGEKGGSKKVYFAKKENHYVVHTYVLMNLVSNTPCY